MKPHPQCITIKTDAALIEKFLKEVVVDPHQIMVKWAGITNQTPATKLGYVGQHLASLLTGVPGTGTGARGDDLADHTEVKSCNKVDQVDKCKSCGGRVMRMQKECPTCHSTKIERKQDSKWLFSVKNEQELNQYLNMDRIVLILFDYPHFAASNFNDIRIRAYEIYPKEKRGERFCQLISNHYYNIYLPKVEKKEKTNPMNLHPELIQFYLCNPVKIYECIIQDFDNNPVFHTTLFISPVQERDLSLSSEPMPSSLLEKEEMEELVEKASYKKEIEPLLKTKLSKEEFRNLSDEKRKEVLPFIDENLRRYIPLRNIVSTTQHTPYQRG